MEPTLSNLYGLAVRFKYNEERELVEREKRRKMLNLIKGNANKTSSKVD
jgi:hypothetical protein